VRYCRFVAQPGGPPRFGVIDGEQVQPLTQAPWLGGKADGAGLRLADVKLRAPSEPSKIVAVGLNYRSHAEEMKKPLPAEPLLFIKPSTAVNDPGSPIRLPPDSQEVHHEAELALVIGQRVFNATEAEASRAIFGLTCFNDVTARDIQRREIQHTRSKSYDTFACMGPWLETELSPADLRVTCRVRGEVRQDGRTSDLIFSSARLVSFISRIMTLLPGDVVSTGTPSGVGPLRAGDVVEVEIAGIGTLSNPVQSST
jgi:2-keto-4-pentenoate hydratase/2-oxohepta-3-ene-1,7-dioic acid hydratase in catechol pathway